MTRINAPQSEEHELVLLLRDLQKDLTTVKARLSEAQRQVTALNLKAKPKHVCPDPICRLEFKAATKLAEHVYHSHDGPLPAHYAAAEDAADA